MDFIAELKWRGLLHDAMPGLEEQLAKRKADKMAKEQRPPNAPSVRQRRAHVLPHARRATHTCPRRRAWDTQGHPGQSHPPGAPQKGTKTPQSKYSSKLGGGGVLDPPARCATLWGGGS